MPTRSASRLAPTLAPALALALLLAACGGSDDDAATDDPAPVTTAATGATTTTGAGADDTAAPGDDTGPAADWVYPGTAWETADPAEHGLSQEGLDELATYLEGTNSNCMMVVKDGVVVDERYWNGTDVDSNQEIFSASKSVSSTLVGIAQDEGLLDIEQPASDFITEWVGTDSEPVTIRNLLSNDSGRYYDFKTDYQDMVNSPNRTEFAIGLDQQYPPGEHWEYNNSAIQTLQRVLADATGESVNAFAAERLFGPLGMTAEYSTDPSGTEPTFMGVQAGCDDMARFGYLFLRDGWWDGEQVVSSDWVEEATAPSQELNPAYGFLWWLNAQEGALIPGTNGTVPGAFWPDAPADAYAALGLGDQIVLVLPDQDMVVVRAGSFGGGGAAGADQPVSNTSVNEVARLALAAEG